MERVWRTYEWVVVLRRGECGEGSVEGECGWRGRLSGVSDWRGLLCVEISVEGSVRDVLRKEIMPEVDAIGGGRGCGEEMGGGVRWRLACVSVTLCVREWRKRERVE